MQKLHPSERMKLIRESMGMNQKQFADKLGFKPSYYSELERGKKEITARVLNMLIANFQVSSDWILSGLGEKNATVRSEENFNKLPTSGKKPHVEEKTPEKLDLTKEENEKPIKLVDQKIWLDKARYYENNNGEPILLANPGLKEILELSKDKNKRHLLERYTLPIKERNIHLESYWENRLKNDLIKERKDLSDLQDNIAFFSVYQEFMEEILATHFQDLMNISFYALPLLINKKADYKDFKDIYLPCLDSLKAFAPMLEKLIPALKESVREAMKIDPDTSSSFFGEEDLE